MPTSQKGDPGKRAEEDRKSFERALQEVGQELPDDLAGVEGADVGSIERHHHEHSEAEALNLGHVEPAQPMDWAAERKAKERGEGRKRAKGASASTSRDPPAKR